MRLNKLESWLVISEEMGENCILVVSRKGEREHTREGVWKSLASKLQCIYIQNSDLVFIPLDARIKTPTFI